MYSNRLKVMSIRRPLYGIATLCGSSGALFASGSIAAALVMMSLGMDSSMGSFNVCSALCRHDLNSLQRIAAIAGVSTT